MTLIKPERPHETVFFIGFSVPPSNSAHEVGKAEPYSLTPGAFSLKWQVTLLRDDFGERGNEVRQHLRERLRRAELKGVALQSTAQQLHGDLEACFSMFFMVASSCKQLQGSFFRRGARIAGLWRARWLPGCLSGRCDRWISRLLKLPRRSSLHVFGSPSRSKSS